MTALAEKLKSAGIDTVGASLTAACTEGIRLHPDNVVDAWCFVGAKFGYDFVRSLMGNDKTVAPREKPKSQQAERFAPRIIPTERLEKRRELQHIIRSKYRNSGDVPWSDVEWCELSGLKRDGKEADALLNAGPPNIPNDGRSVGEVLGVKKTDEIIARVRGVVMKREA